MLLTSHRIPNNAVICLDDIWARQGQSINYLHHGTLLWHCGIIGPQYPMRNEMLWTTNNESEKHRYAGLARGEGRRKRLPAFSLELFVMVELKLADFKGTSLKEFTETECNFDHNTMKKYLQQWIELRELNGIHALNSNMSEVVVNKPLDHLFIQSSTEL
jgi:hypothetical protein